jgi:uncharacterized membrane protein
MTAWDLALDPTTSTINHAWIWENAGSVRGSPLSRRGRTRVSIGTAPV